MELAERVGTSGNSARDGWIEARREGDLIVLRTGPRVLRRARAQAILVGLGVVLSGLGLLLLSPWAAALAAAGALYAALAPRRVQPAFLAAVDTAAERLTGPVDVSVSQVTAIRGVFETKGWDGFSTVYALLDDGSSVPIALLMGANERLAEALCAELGRLIGRPAEYAGTSGVPVACHTPAA